MKIRHEINVLNREVTGASGKLPEPASITKSSYSGVVSSYLEIVSKISSGSGTVTLSDENNADKVAFTSALGHICDSIHGNGTYIFTAHRGDGIGVWTVDSNGLVLVNHHDDGGVYCGIWSDSDFVYTAAYSNGFKVFSIGVDGTLTATDSDVYSCGYPNYYENIHTDGTYFYLTAYYCGVHSYSVNSSGIITKIDYSDDGSYPYTSVFAQGGFVFCGQTASGGLWSYSVSSGNLTMKYKYDTNTPRWWALDGDGTYLFAAASDGLYVFSYDTAGVLTLVDSDYQSGANDNSYVGVYYNGTYIYVSQEEVGKRIYTFNGSSLTYVGTLGPAGVSSKNGYYEDTYFLYAGGPDGTGVLLYADPAEITVNTTSYSRYRVQAPIPATGGYLYLSSSAISIIAARLVILQDTDSLTGSESQFEIGTYAYDMWTNGVTQPLVSPKYWYYDSSKWDGTIAIYGEVVWVSLEDKEAVSIYIQQDDGSFGNWTTVSTLVSAGGNEVISITRGTDFSASLTSGRNYRLAVNSLGAKAGKGVTIYSAKIIVVQTTETLITKMEEQFLLANSEQTSTGLKLFNSLYSASEFDSVTVDIFPEHDADNANANTKLQEGVDGTPSDVASSSITGNNRTRGTTALSITDGEEISTNIVAVS